MRVYLLQKEHEHLFDMAYDIALLPYPGSENLKYQLLSTDKINIERRIDFLANFNVVKSNTDYPVVEDDIEVFSKKMLNTIERVGELNVRKFPITLIDDTYIVDNRFDADGQIRQDVPTISYFYIIQILTFLKVFDYDNSEYKVLRSNPNMPGIIKKLVLKEPQGGFPPLFRIFEKPSSVFVSQKAKEALEANNIKGCVFEEVEVS